jgi:3-oxoadipate enol-lactonase
MALVTVDGIDIYYERTGAGRPVLFISGTGGDLRHRPAVLDGPLGAGGFDVVAYDQRGLGRSAKPKGPYSMAAYADDAAGLAAAVGWSACAVIGVSFGGMVAQELVVRHPGLVERLVLCCTSPGGAGGSSYPLHELQEMAPDVRERRMIALSDTRYDESWQAAHPKEMGAMLSMGRARAVVGAGEPGREEGAALQLAARATHDVWDGLPAVAAPTLVCAGRYDGIAPVANSEAIAGRIPGAELAVFEGGHLFLLQDRAAWPRILDFLVDPGDDRPGPAS